MPRTAISVHPPGALQLTDPPAREFQELWFALARRNWASIAIVPGGPEGSAVAVATALADVGMRLSEVPVTAITATSLDYGSARALADLETHVGRERPSGPIIDVPSRIAETDGETDGAGDEDPRPTAIVQAGRVIVALPSVVAEPLGLGITGSADAVILCIEMGKTRLKDVRRTIELVGRERIAGCFLSAAAR